MRPQRLGNRAAPQHAPAHLGEARAALKPMPQHRNWRTAGIWLAVIVCCIASLATPSDAPAQRKPLEEIVAYQGADREQRLLEAAKREGEFTLYSALTTE